MRLAGERDRMAMRRAPGVRGDVVAAPGGVAVDVDATGRAMARPRRTCQEEEDGGNQSCPVEASHVPSGLLVGYQACLRPGVLLTAAPRRVARKRTVVCLMP